MTPDRFLVGNGRWCSTCFPDGPPMNWDWNKPVGRGRRGIRRGCNECAGAGRIAFTSQEIVDATVAEVRKAKAKKKEARR